MKQETTTISGYKVTFIDFEVGNDMRLFIDNPEGVQIYAHRTSSKDGYLETAKREIGYDMERRGIMPEVEPIAEAVQEIEVEGETRRIEYDTVIAHCGCECNRADRTTISYCERHEGELIYWQAVHDDYMRSMEYAEVYA